MVATPKLFGGLLFSTSGAKSAQADVQSSLPETSPAPASEVPAPASPQIRGRIQTRAKAKAKVAASPLKKPSAAEPSPKRRQSSAAEPSPKRLRSEDACKQGLKRKWQHPVEADAKPNAKPTQMEEIVGETNGW